MKNIKIAIILLTATTIMAFTYTNYFEGPSNLQITIDPTDSNNIWQIGNPQKTIFNSASSAPNALVTDTINNYQPNDTSSFIVHIPRDTVYYGIHAIQWVQKLDIDTTHAYGKIEISTDSGQTWVNVFGNPKIYNLFGYDTLNLDTVNGDIRFIGADTNWANIWMCIDAFYYNTFDSVQLKYTFVADSSSQTREGWMLDNFYAQVTIPHTLAYIEDSGKDFEIYPNPSSGTFNLKVDPNKNNIINKIEVVDGHGRIVKTYGKAPRKFAIDINELPNGYYFVKVYTDQNQYSASIQLAH